MTPTRLRNIAIIAHVDHGKTTLSVDRKRALNLGDSTTLIDLGTFADCLHGHDFQQRLAFDLRLNLPGPMELSDPFDKSARYPGETLALHAELAAASISASPT